MPTPYQQGLKGIPVTQPLDETQVKNNAGGYVWQVDKWGRARRFLILGNEGGSYYVSEQKLSRENALSLIECLKEDGKRLVDLIVEVSDGGLAYKNDPAIFALALASSAQYANGTSGYALEQLPRVCRTATHLFTFVGYVREFRGMGRGLRSAIANWYATPEAGKIAYQMVKYRQRNGWSHRDLLRLAHPQAPTAAHNALFRWAVGKSWAGEGIPELAEAFIKVQDPELKRREVIAAIREHGLTREMLPTHWLNDAGVWGALLENMPMTAMIRNLGKMNAVGLVLPLSEAEGQVVAALADAKRLEAARIHPIGILAALRVYGQGHGERGSLEWQPSQRVMDALDAAFYMTFQNIEPTNKRWLLALDISGSMTWGTISGIPGLTPREASAAMALVTAKVEPQYHMVGFSHELVPLDISAGMRLRDVETYISSIPMGGTDCSVPMLYAMERKIPVDTFVVYTDSETWYSKHPAQMLDEYRQATGIPAQLIVVGMIANDFTIARPGDAGMLDVVGFDPGVPSLMGEFALGRV